MRDYFKKEKMSIEVYGIETMVFYFFNATIRHWKTRTLHIAFTYKIYSSIKYIK